jgi:hypothetical protein
MREPGSEEGSGGLVNAVVPDPGKSTSLSLYVA